ncbi:MAG: alkaline phosphatase family protein [Anaerolineaceae bacterium]|nr:alkaline phosphatase family protein [Anaerolineaceae bacterium]
MNGNRKLFVFLMDALCASDVEFIKTLPHMSRVIREGSLIEHVEPIYPSFTYPCHCAIVTGNTVKGHGIPHNEKLEVENNHAPWYNQRSDIRCDTIFDYARRAGMKTCSLSWPVSGGADIDYNMPMIVPMHYTGYDPLQYLVGNASQNLLDEYYWKYGRYIKGEDRSLDLFTMALAPDIIRDFGQPDLMYVKMCDLDTKRHNHGVRCPEAYEQLRKHDEEFAVLEETIRRYGDYENTNFVILGDHGHQDIKHYVNMNMVLRNHGFIRTNEANELLDYDAYCFSTCMSGWVKLKNPEDREMYKKVYEFLLGLRDDPDFPIGVVMTKEEVLERYGLTGPLDFVIEGPEDEPTEFEATLAGEDIFKVHLGPGLYFSVASHGHMPERDETTTFFACGPSVRKGVVIPRTKMINEAPTMAAMVGLNMDKCEGHVIKEILAD